jgi:hypothetical protein
MLADEAGESADGGEPLVAGSDSTLTCGLDIGEKTANEISRDIVDVKAVDRFFQRPGDERDQQGEPIAIAVLGVAGKIAFGHHMFQQETPDPWAKQGTVFHGDVSRA